jgi:hypothetical protein
MGRFLKFIGLGRKDDFVSRVLARYRSNKPMSPFVRGLFESESAESINARFAKAKNEMKK